jgi:hypothetical protein
MGVIGPHRNVYYALGYSGHGLALGALAGRVLRDLYSGDHDPWRALPFYQKRWSRPIPRPGSTRGGTQSARASPSTIWRSISSTHFW